MAATLDSVDVQHAYHCRKVPYTMLTMEETRGQETEECP